VTGLALSRTKDSPEYAQFRTVADKFGIKCETGCAQQFLFYGYGKVIQAALEAAGKNPTRESLAAGIKTIKDYPTLATAPISYSDTNFIGTDQMFPAKCCAPDNTWIGTGPAANKF
jgi:hypothetical protein